jgi:hypothetical protein
LILISKRVLEPIFVSDDSLTALGASTSLTSKKDSMSNKEFKEWLEKLTNEVITKDEGFVPGGNGQNMKKFLL